MDSGPAHAMMGLAEEGPFQSPMDTSGSSMASFTQEIRELVERQGAQHDRTWLSSPVIASSTSKANGLGRLGPSSSKAQKDLDYVLPPRQKADHLLDTYWKLVDVAYPFVDKADVTARYHRLWTGEDFGPDAAMFVCLLNAMFGVASLVDPLKAPEDRVADGKVFYQRAGPLDMELVQVRSLLTVQCFLLLSHYAHSPQGCWMYVGLAIRAAQSLGLDLPSTSAQVKDAERRNLLRRVWHGCVLMDRTCSMIYGQPTMINPATAANVPYPTPHPDDSVYGCCNSSTSTGSSSPQRDRPENEYHFFIESIKLFELVEDCLSTSRTAMGAQAGARDEDPYTSIFGRGGLHAVHTMLRAEGRLWLWNRRLPAHLQRQSSSSPDSSSNPTATEMPAAIHVRQSNVLQLRSQHFRMLLFRPMLLRLCSRPDMVQLGKDSELDETLMRDLALRGSVTCVETAMEIIHFFRSIAHDQTLDRLLPAWWYNTFYIYSAAWVVVAATLQPAVMEAVTKQRLLSAYKDAVALLHSFERLDPSVERYIVTLKFTFERMMRRSQSRRQSPPRQASNARPGVQDGPQTLMSSTMVEQPMSGKENSVQLNPFATVSLDPLGPGPTYVFSSPNAENTSDVSLQQQWPEAFLWEFSPSMAFDLPGVDFDSTLI